MQLQVKWHSFGFTKVKVNPFITHFWTSDLVTSNVGIVYDGPFINFIILSSPFSTSEFATAVTAVFEVFVNSNKIFVWIAKLLSNKI